jgi:hypothetical protein
MQGQPPRLSSRAQLDTLSRCFESQYPLYWGVLLNVARFQAE